MTPEKFQMFENRLLKNYKHRLKQAKRLSLTCWRLYDHDLPEFPICIEFYEEYIYIAEYNRRHALTDEEHAIWFDRTKDIISTLTGVPVDHMYVKLRKRMSHREGQYEKEEVTESKIINVEMNDAEKKAAVYLKPDQVSLAIGRGGHNIKLAGKLTGYEIDVYRENADEDEEDVDLEEFSDEIEGWIIDEFKRIGLDTAKSVLALSADELLKRTDLEEDTINEVLSILKAEFE